MTSYSEQLAAARRARQAVNALETVSRERIDAIFARWENGEYTDQSVRWALERVVRAAYRSASSLGIEHAKRSADIPDWDPVAPFSSEYLTNLLADVRRNLREYKKSAKDEKAKRRATFRMRHSAGVAAQRGYTDALVSTGRELRDFGMRIRKVWMANFVNNTPCEHCVALHGSEVDLDKSFQTESNTLKTYGDLIGPPRHPNCRCYLVTLIVTLDNVLEALDVGAPPQDPPQTMTTDEVKALPKGIFGSIVKMLQTIVQAVVRSFRG